MKIETLEKLNEFLKEYMNTHEIHYDTFFVYNVVDEIKVNIEAWKLTTESIVFLGNCLKKFKDGVLYSDANI